MRETSCLHCLHCKATALYFTPGFLQFTIMPDTLHSSPTFLLWSERLRRVSAAQFFRSNLSSNDASSLWVISSPKIFAALSSWSRVVWGVFRRLSSNRGSQEKRWFKSRLTWKLSLQWRHQEWFKVWVVLCIVKAKAREALVREKNGEKQTMSALPPHPHPNFGTK